MRWMQAVVMLAIALMALRAAVAGEAAPSAEYSVKRESVFEFVQTPKVTRSVDRIEITFESKGYCDATVAIEQAQGKIVRHLACGVLGEKAPPPFQIGSLKQILVWDGKDDRGKYIDDQEACSVRVSLGLKPQFERSLFHHPQRRCSRFPPLICARPEGVYVYDGGRGVDHLRLLDHEGNYQRTIYPFPSVAIEQVQGLLWHQFPQDGLRLPIKGNFLQNTFLTSGTNAYQLGTYNAERMTYRSVVGDHANAHYGMEGAAGSALAVAGEQVALANVLVNRFSTDGTSGGLPLQGPRIDFEIKNTGNLNSGEIQTIPPRSAALSPDGKTLYLSGYVFAHAIGRASADIVVSENWDAFHVVMKLDLAKNDPPTVFAGSVKAGAAGNGPSQFDTPTCVATDSQGRIYVADYQNDRVQVFSPEGKVVLSLPHKRPAWVRVHQKTGELYVFSWRVATTKFDLKDSVSPSLTRYSALPEAKKLETVALPDRNADSASYRYGTTFYQYFADLDSWTAEPRVWLVQDWAMENTLTRANPSDSAMEIYGIKNGKLNPIRTFEKELARAEVPVKVQRLHRQRLFANAKTGELYLAEGNTFLGNAFKEVFIIDPETGKFRKQDLPFDAEDMCLDMDGLAYLRTIDTVGRFNPAEKWREVPFDYGEERAKVHTSSSSDRREGSLICGLALPANGCWHHGGMWISPRGHLAVTCNYDPDGPAGHTSEAALQGNRATLSPGVPGSAVYKGSKYELPIYPGRMISGRGGAPIIHIWDREGKPLHRDCLPGLGDNTYGIGIDNDDGLYLLAAPTRVLNGQPHFNDMTGTLVKVRPGKTKIYSTDRGIAVPLASPPSGTPDLQSSGQGSAWAREAEWFFGGVGYCGKNKGIGCACFNTRMTFDYFNRSFAPEMDRYSVAVLDANGNLILRFGRYGNADDGKPLIPDPSIPNPHSIGGDEVALMHGSYLGTHTDRRVYVADTGNARVLSIKLGYHAEARIQLKAVKDTVAEK